MESYERKGRDISGYTEEYLSSPFLKENSQYRRRAIIRELKKYDHSRVLEIGCGIYPLISFINPREYDNWTIVEPSTIFAGNAKKYADDYYLNEKVDVICDFFENTDLNRNYDFIICSSLLHEVKIPELLFDNILKVCGNNTIVHVNVPNAKSLHRLIAFYGGLLEDIHTLSDRNIMLQQRTVYDLERLIAESEKAGFEIIDKGSFFVKPFTHSQMEKMIEYGIINDFVMEGLWGLAQEFPEYGSEIFLNMRKKIKSDDKNK